MINEIKTLTGFKRYLENGGKIQLLTVDGEKAGERISGIRTVEKMQKESCKFTGGSWLYFPKASGFKIENEIVTLDLDAGKLVYKLIK